MCSSYPAPFHRTPTCEQHQPAPAATAPLLFVCRPVCCVTQWLSCDSFDQCEGTAGACSVTRLVVQLQVDLHAIWRSAWKSVWGFYTTLATYDCGVWIPGSKYVDASRLPGCLRGLQECWDQKNCQYMMQKALSCSVPGSQYCQWLLLSIVGSK